MGRDDNTSVIFASDNGASPQKQGGSNGELRGRKGQTWEGGQRVPCIVRWPGNINPGTECDQIATTMDFLPPITNLIQGKKPSKKIDGIEMTDLFFSNDKSSKRDNFFYYNEDDLEAYRYKNWKLHLKKEGTEVQELYDLSKDIGETNNIFDDNKDIVEQLLISVNNCIETLGDKSLNITGSEIRKAGRIENPKTLTTFEENHPYMYAEYDKGERG